jgi:hypothetical protein
VGEDGARAAWLVAQHLGGGEPALQQRCAELLAVAVAAGDADPEHLAAVSDRVELEAGRSQIYGTHLQPDKVTGWRAVRGIADLAGVDARRAAIGLPPWAAYVDGVRAQSGA